MVVSPKPITHDSQLVTPIGLLKVMDEFALYILIDQHIIDGVLIIKQREEYRSWMKEIHEDMGLAIECIYILMVRSYTLMTIRMTYWMIVRRFSM